MIINKLSTFIMYFVYVLFVLLHTTILLMFLVLI